ncbi:hypothetical protein [Actinacidiphila yeochonensis]|uniref:hypothetical protein n=1 Tax=Actinacidiphila yeochonensis TaxID=89050 RepID=UPI001E5FB3AD|nr:hypothetical protein [Actinacidiphila yeochonensis]
MPAGTAHRPEPSALPSAPPPAAVPQPQPPMSPPSGVPGPVALPTASTPALPGTVQRSAKAAPAKVVPLRRPAAPAGASGSSPLPVASLSAPSAHSAPDTAMPVVQRFGRKSGRTAGSPAGGPAPHRSARSTVGALAAAAAATVAGTFSGVSGRTHRPADPPPPYTPGSSAESSAPPPYDPPPPYSSPPPPEYTAVPDGAFDPKQLTEYQLDELAHQLIGRITRLIRTELRLDRERIGKLRDPRR